MGTEHTTPIKRRRLKHFRQQSKWLYQPDPWDGKSEKNCPHAKEPWDGKKDAHWMNERKYIN